MTIIHLSSSLGGGGAEQMVLQLAKQSNPNIKTIVFSISSENELEPLFKESKIEYHFLNITSFRNSTLTNGLKQLHDVVKDLKSVVFHCHQFHGVILGLLYKFRYSNVPIIFTLHSSTIEIYWRKIVLASTKWARKKDVIFSNNVKRWYLKNNAIIPNGVDFELFDFKSKRYYSANEKFTFLYLGRLSKEKNPLFMIGAAKHLLERGINNFKFEVVGIGYLLEELKDLITKNNLQDYFFFAGFQTDIKPYLSKAHCLILPSHWEGMPVVIIEASASKLPIIATPVGSIPDFLNNSNSYISSLQEFPKSMVDVIENYPEAIKKTELLHNEMNSIFNIDSVYVKHLELYKSLKA